MGYNFWNDKDELWVSNSMTAAVFELAEKHGWNDPMQNTALGCVPLHDASLLADTLERAMDTLSDTTTEHPENEFASLWGREHLKKIIRLARSGGFMYQH